MTKSARKISSRRLPLSPGSTKVVGLRFVIHSLSIWSEGVGSNCRVREAALLRSAIVSFLVAGFSSLAARLRGVSDLGATLWRPIRSTSSSRTCDVFQEARLCWRLVKRGRPLLPAIGIDGGPVSFPSSHQRTAIGRPQQRSASSMANRGCVTSQRPGRGGSVTDRTVRGRTGAER